MLTNDLELQNWPSGKAISCISANITVKEHEVVAKNMKFLPNKMQISFHFNVWKKNFMKSLSIRLVRNIEYLFFYY